MLIYTHRWLFFRLAAVETMVQDDRFICPARLSSFGLCLILQQALFGSTIDTSQVTHLVSAQSDAVLARQAII